MSCYVTRRGLLVGDVAILQQVLKNAGRPEVVRAALDGVQRALQHLLLDDVAALLVEELDVLDDQDFAVVFLQDDELHRKSELDGFLRPERIGQVAVFVLVHHGMELLNVDGVLPIVNDIHEVAEDLLTI